jgi:hypothetical protein
LEYFALTPKHNTPISCAWQMADKPSGGLWVEHKTKSSNLWGVEDVSYVLMTQYNVTLPLTPYRHEENEALEVPAVTIECVAPKNVKLALLSTGWSRVDKLGQLGEKSFTLSVRPLVTIPRKRQAVIIGVVISLVSNDSG